LRTRAKREAIRTQELANRETARSAEQAKREAIRTAMAEDKRAANALAAEQKLMRDAVAPPRPTRARKSARVEAADAGSTTSEPIATGDGDAGAARMTG
jgi:hypothetical protein